MNDPGVPVTAAHGFTVVGLVEVRLDGFLVPGATRDAWRAPGFYVLAAAYMRSGQFDRSAND